MHVAGGLQFPLLNRYILNQAIARSFVVKILAYHCIVLDCGSLASGPFLYLASSSFGTYSGWLADISDSCSRLQRPNRARILRCRLLNYAHRRINALVNGPEGGEPNDARSGRAACVGIIILFAATP